MMPRRAIVGCVLWIVSSVTLLYAEAPQGIKKTALDDYIAAPDATYAWSVAKTIESAAGKTTMIKLKSQSWMTEKEVDRPVWEHWLAVVVPKKLVTNKAFLLISGGANDRPMPEGADAMSTLIAQSTGSVVIELRMVPNQPLVFHADGQPRKEDDLIGYGLAEFLKDGDAKWISRLPMTKSAVRAMDCVQEFMASEAGGNVTIEKFVVAGGSKRGWTTWMTGAADARVEAIIPIVIDVANTELSIRHHAEVYGFWADAIGNYYQHKVLQQYDHPKMKDINRIEDPYSYRDRLTMPKFIVNASGDEFFCPDSSQFYYDDLRGEKLIRYVPNANHSLKESDAIQSIIAYYQLIIAGKERPKYSWTFEQDGSIQVKSESALKQATLWQATNPKARDFRVDTIGRTYRSTELKPDASGAYTGRISPPAEGWTAFFVELTIDAGVAQPLKVSTAVRILPDKLPYAGIDLKTVPYEGELRASAAAK